MKPARKSEPKTKRSSRIYSGAFCLTAVLVTALQVGCSSTGAFPAPQQVFRPPTPTGYSAEYSNQGWGGQQNLFPSQPYGQNFGQSYGQTYGQSQYNPAAGQFGFSGANPGSQFQPAGYPTQWRAGYQNMQSQWQNLQSNFNPNFNPFGFAKTTC